MSNVLFLSDTHLGHTNILKWRTKFRTIEEHDDAILKGIADRVTKRDDLWLLGDVVFGAEACEKLSQLLRGIGCQTHVVLGNHDLESRTALKSADGPVPLVRLAIPEPGKMGKMLSQFHGLVKYHEFWLSHAPIHPVELRGKVNIHGHVHDRSIVLPDGQPDPNYFNVSCDVVDFRPVSLHEIRQAVAKRLLVK